MTWEYRWQTTPYDTQRWEYRRHRGSHSQRLGEVHRVIRARQSYDERVHEYQARAFGVLEKKVFDTKEEAIAWITACERM